MTLLDSEDDFSATGHTAFGGLSDALQQFGQQISGALQIPLVRLFGQSPAGFSTGESDLRAYYDTIRQTQEKDLRYVVTMVYRAIAASEEIELPKGTRIEFKPLWQLTEKEKAEISERVGKNIGNLNSFGIISKATALRELRQNSYVTGICTNITDQMITDAENETTLEDISPLPAPV